MEVSTDHRDEGRKEVLLIPCDDIDVFNSPIAEFPLILDLRSKSNFRESHIISALSIDLTTDTSDSHIIQEFYRGMYGKENEQLVRNVHHSKLQDTFVNPDGVICCNGGYPDAFQYIYLYSDEEDIDAIDASPIMDFIRRRGAPLFFFPDIDLTVTDNEDIEWTRPKEALFLGSYSSFSSEFPFLITRNHSFRFGSDTLLGRSVIAQEEEVYFIPAANADIIPAINNDEAGVIVSVVEEPLFYPSIIEKSGLFLGSNNNAKDLRVLRQLGINVVLNLTVECPNHFERKSSFTTVLNKLVLEAHALEESVQSTVGDDGDSEAADITYFRYPALDTNRQVMTEYWEEAFKVLEASLAEGKRALVHCHAGKSRSASLIAYYLMKKYDYTLSEAMAHLTKRRRQICINGNFMAQLFSVSKDCD